MALVSSSPLVSGKPQKALLISEPGDLNSSLVRREYMISTNWKQHSLETSWTSKAASGY